MVAYYMIHACNKRLWYVKHFLIPSMLEQDILPENILIYVDKNRIGNLRAWVDSCNRLAYKVADNSQIRNVWHLQDDVVISKNFKEITEQYESNAIVCGFTCGYDNEPKAGTFQLAEYKMWYSFPCINISTALTTEFAKWANVNLWQSKHFKEAVRRNNGDDLIFREWLYDNYPGMYEINLAPNVVNHIDKWLGGSVCNQQRDPEKDTMSMYWEDNGELAELKDRLEKYRKVNIDSNSNV